MAKPRTARTTTFAALGGAQPWRLDRAEPIDGSDDFATKLANKANAARDAFLGIGDRLVGGPITQTARGVGRVRGVNKLGQRMQVIRCR